MVVILAAAVMMVSVVEDLNVVLTGGSGVLFLTQLC